MKLDFRDSTLMISTRSPFARRVSLALLEHGVPYAEKALDIWQLQPEVLRVNPLNRVPTIILGSGQTLVDSNLILAAFYEWVGETPWLPRDPAERAAVYFWSAMAVGIIEKTIECFLENQRPVEKRDGQVLEESEGLFNRTLARLETHLEGREAVVGRVLTQADLDLGVALGYLDFRYGTSWREKFPRVVAYQRRLEARPFFERTRPRG